MLMRMLQKPFDNGMSQRGDMANMARTILPQVAQSHYHIMWRGNQTNKNKASRGITPSRFRRGLSRSAVPHKNWLIEHYQRGTQISIPTDWAVQRFQHMRPSIVYKLTRVANQVPCNTVWFELCICAERSWNDYLNEGEGKEGLYIYIFCFNSTTDGGKRRFYEYESVNDFLPAQQFHHRRNENNQKEYLPAWQKQKHNTGEERRW